MNSEGGIIAGRPLATLETVANLKNAHFQLAGRPIEQEITMSKALKTFGTIAAGAALVAGTIATAGIGSAGFIAAAGKVAGYASLPSAAEQIGVKIKVADNDITKRASSWSQGLFVGRYGDMGRHHRGNSLLRYKGLPGSALAFLRHYCLLWKKPARSG